MHPREKYPKLYIVSYVYCLSVILYVTSHTNTTFKYLNINQWTIEYLMTFMYHINYLDDFLP